MRLPDQWPDLQGRVLLGFRIIWVITFLFALVSIAQAVQRDFLDRQLTENMSALGLASVGLRGSHAIRPVAPQQDHDIRDGDRLIAVDGRPVGSLRETVAATTGPDGAVTVLTLHNSGDPNPRSVRVIRDNNAIAETYAGSGLNFGEARNIVVPALVRDGQSIAPREIVEPLGQFLPPGHGGIPNEHRNDSDAALQG